MSDVPFADRLNAALAYVSAQPAHAFDPSGAAAEFDALQPSPRANAEHAVRRFASLTATPSVLYFRARLHSALGDPAAAAAAWSEFAAHSPCRDPLVLLNAARAYAAAEQWDVAALRLREALQCRPEYTFHARARGVIDEVGRHARAGVRRARIAVLGSATTSLLLPLLKSLCFRDGIEGEWYEGMYGAYRQEILDPASLLHRFAPEIVCIIPSWRDLNLPPLAADGRERTVEAVVSEHAALWKTLADRSPCHIVQHAFDLPAAESAGSLSGRRGGRSRVLRQINLRLAEVAPAFVSVLDTERVMTSVGIDAWEDAALWHRARQHPSTRALPALVEQQMAHIRAAVGLTRKVVVCDLDNTLWAGIIGEDGIDGIRVGNPSPEGEAHAYLQQYLKELQARGILLAVASKNNPDEARLPFTKHGGMVLRLEDFAAFEANWDDKATNLRRVAAKLSLGTDSFVFLDDNPFERAWVRSQMPEVAVVELGASPATYVRDLDAGRYFEVLSVSEEDRRRSQLYRVEAEREAFREQAGSLETFLAGLHMRASSVAISDANRARVTQLVNKTNQFNVTTRRYTEAEVSALTARGWCAAFQLSDRFGDHGLVGVMFCQPGSSRRWNIDTWLVSCRVLGRQLEAFMLDRAVEAARSAGITHLRGIYTPTAKNGLVADLFDRFGFVRREATDEGQHYELPLGSVTAPYSSFIEHVSGETDEDARAVSGAAAR
jgi:FkbH-like protein